MVVVVVENVPSGLRGELSRWMLEPHTGVFVGTMSAMVRDKLWEKVTRESKSGRAVLLYPARNEQGFLVRTHGASRREVWEQEGLQLIRECKIAP